MQREEKSTEIEDADSESVSSSLYDDKWTAETSIEEIVNWIMKEKLGLKSLDPQPCINVLQENFIYQKRHLSLLEPWRLENLKLPVVLEACLAQLCKQKSAPVAQQSDYIIASKESAKRAKQVKSNSPSNSPVINAKSPRINKQRAAVVSTSRRTIRESTANSASSAAPSPSLKRPDITISKGGDSTADSEEFFLGLSSEDRERLVYIWELIENKNGEESLQSFYSDLSVQ